MSDYTKATDFASKDTLPTGNAAKIVKGSEIGAEFDAIATAVATKVDQVGDGIDLTGKTVSLDITDLTLETTVDNANDLVAIYDASAAAHRKVDVDDLINAWGADRTLTAGTGLSGGGTLSSDRSFALDLNELGTETSIASGDFLAMVDITDSGSQKITLANVNAALVHDSLSGFVANEHIDHSSVSITAGSGLTGGGTIAASRTVNVGAGTGITVNADDVAVTAGTVLKFNSAQTSSDVYISTSDPTGGSNGDIWLKREA